MTANTETKPNEPHQCVLGNDHDINKKNSGDRKKKEEGGSRWPVDSEWTVVVRQAQRPAGTLMILTHSHSPKTISLSLSLFSPSDLIHRHSPAGRQAISSFFACKGQPADNSSALRQCWKQRKRTALKLPGKKCCAINKPFSSISFSSSSSKNANKINTKFALFVKYLFCSFH